jgi:DNA-binding response OmpR family regulator
MPKILLVDDSRFVGAFLKKALEYEGHQVVWMPDEHDAEKCCHRFPGHLVLVNHAYRNHSGWAVFNGLKQKNQKLPIMLYLLDDCKLSSLTWVVRAVDDALSDMHKDRLRPHGFPFKKGIASANKRASHHEKVPCNDISSTT